MNIKAKLNFDYAFVQGAHNFVQAGMISLASLVLLAKGCSATEVGIVYSLGAVTAILSQTLISNYLDHHPRTSIFKLSILVGILFIGDTILIFFCNYASFFLSLIYIVLLTLFWSLNPIINSLVFKLRTTGYDVNFGVCRSVGSVTYAIMCTFIGIVNAKYGTTAILITGLASTLLFIIAFKLCEKDYNYAIEHRPDDYKELEATEAESVISYGEFIKRNLNYLVAIFGLILMSFGMCFFNNFISLIVANVGGDSAATGTILGFSAWWELPVFFLFARLSKKYKATTLLKFASLFYIFRNVCYASARTTTLLYVGQAGNMLAWPLLYSAMLIFINENFPKSENMRGHALYAIQSSVSNIIGSLTGGLIIDSIGVVNGLYVSTVVCIIGTFIFWRYIDKAVKN